MNNLIPERWAVVGFDRDVAEEIMSDIEDEYDKIVIGRKRSKDVLETYFSDGTILRWIPAKNRFSGYRFNKIWCDIDIEKDILYDVIMPCYRGKMEDIIWI